MAEVTCPFYIGKINKNGGEYSDKKICGLHPMIIGECSGEVEYLGTEVPPVFDIWDYKFKCHDRNEEFRIGDGLFCSYISDNFNEVIRNLHEVSDDNKRILGELGRKGAINRNRNIRSKVKEQIGKYEETQSK